MPATEIPDLPDDVRAALAEQARQRGLAPAELIREILIREAGFSRNLAVLRDAAQWGGGADETPEAGGGMPGAAGGTPDGGWHA